MKAYLIIERGGEVIWGAFEKKKDAVAFVKREFTEGNIEVVGLRVYKSLKKAPTTTDGRISWAVDLSPASSPAKRSPPAARPRSRPSR